jgi:putative Mg2+ transporter-C (MgtC) family protein
VTGIGFLAAGSVFKEERIHGLTTAADIWVLAAIGMAVGFGYYFFALAATLISLAILVFGRPFNKWIPARPKK